MKRIIGRIDPNDKNVTIWGAGFSGLVLGHYLKAKGYKVSIHERSNKIGGKIQTKKSNAGLVERGPNALYLNADGLELIRALKLEPIPATKKLKRLLLINGKPRRPFQLGLLSKIGLSAGKKPPLVTDGLTVADFFRPLLGQEYLDQFVSPVLAGIYAMPAEALHFKTVFDQVKDKAQFDSYWDFIGLMLRWQKSQPKLDLSGSVSFEGGMQTLIQALAASLKNDIKLNSKESFKLKGNTVICADAANASELLKESLPEFALELSRIKYQRLSSSTVFMKREIRSLSRAFGVLIPFDSNYHSIGIINNKAIFPANNENVLPYTFIARKNLSEEELYQDLKNLVHDFSPDDVDHIETTDWEKALPVYDLQRYLAVKKLHQLARTQPKLAIFGNYVAGISLREMISAAKRFSENPTDYEEVR